jgi:tRNA A-37 threonylcarbamoyl transferase component Bud32
MSVFSHDWLRSKRTDFLILTPQRRRKMAAESTDTHNGENVLLESLGAPLFKSRSSEVYPWQEGTLLKLFRPNVEPVLIENEEINTTEAYEKGVSQVKCFGHVTVGDRTGIIIGRVPGKTLIALLGSKPLILFQASAIMAEQQWNMHQAHTSKIRSYKEIVLEALDSKPLAFLTQEEKATAVKKINALPEGDSILHFDFHPDNIMSDGQNVTIIDWMTAARGVPAADVAATLYLLNEGEMIPGLSKTVAAILEKIRKSICKNYYALYKKKTGMTDAEVAPWRLPFLIFRLGIWNIESEVPVLQQKIRDELAQ